MHILPDVFVLVTIWISLSIYMEVECKESCYYVNFIYTNWTDDRPRFIVNMTFSNQNGVGSTTTINEPILSPVSKMLIVQQSPKEKKRIIYNVTTKLCAMQGILNAVPLFKPAKESVLKQSNYTFSCPLNKGVYVMNNMRVNPRNPLLSLMHQAKGIFTVMGALLEELPNSQMHPLSTYNIAGKIIRKSCGKNE
ncbi:uncharacterized protein LOC115765542 [Drosophila novamexicana]|uniref:uncharacterized protein LOC115765542 n=1 Tax=Drosophila novamexicana TaxID=47314 RepID=UPI0011E59576|nr:uncharacterized protein LOC115765542 [Drosophila novamexicana]